MFLGDIFKKELPQNESLGSMTKGIKHALPSPAVLPEETTDEAKKSPGERMQKALQREKEKREYSERYAEKHFPIGKKPEPVPGSADDNKPETEGSLRTHLKHNRFKAINQRQRKEEEVLRSAMSRVKDEVDESDHRGLEHELGHETNNIEISINGRPWKIFAGKGSDSSPEFFKQKQTVDAMCKRKTQESGKKWTWAVTGAPATMEAANPAQQAAIAINMKKHNKKPKHVNENAEELNIGDPVIITGPGIEFEGATGEIAEFGRDKRFVVVNLYNHGKHSFHSSDVSYNDHADIDEGRFVRGPGGVPLDRRGNPIVPKAKEPAPMRMQKWLVIHDGSHGEGGEMIIDAPNFETAWETANEYDLDIIDIKPVKGVAEGSDEAEKYKAQLLKTAPRIMDFLAKTVKGWRPSEEEMLSAIDTAYMVMKHTGDVKQAGKAMMDELNTLHRMSQGQQGVAEAGPFSYGKAPRKGSVADLAAKKRREQEQGKQPIEPKDQQVGVAKVTKGVAEGLPQTLRKVVPGHAKREIDKKMDAEKFGRTDVDKDANYWRYKKIQDKLKEEGVAEGLDSTRRRQIILFLAKKLDWEVNYLELASDANLIDWYKRVQAGKQPMGEEFTGYWKGTDQRTPGKHMVGGESVDHDLLAAVAESLARDGYEFTEEKVRLDPKCWTGKKIGNPKTKIKGGVRVNNCVPK